MRTGGEKESCLCLVGILLAVGLSGVDHVSQRGLGLLPLTGLETAIGVDPELVGLEVPNST